MHKESKFGQWLRETREGLGLRQVDLAEQIGTYVATISRWERGISRPKAENCVALARVFGVDSHTIMELADGNLGLLLPIVAPPAYSGASNCSKCIRLRQCRRDVANDLPAWCEAPDEHDLVVARGAGRSSDLKARYERSHHKLAHSVLQPGDQEAVPAGAE